ELYGVIEIGSTKQFNDNELKFFDISSEIITTTLFSSIKNEKVTELLKDTEVINKQLQKEKRITEKSNKELQKQQVKLEEANSQMQEQQAQLEEANSQMQEQQAQLEEANAQMEEQQVQLKHSEKELKKQNKILEKSKEILNEKAIALEESNKYKSEFLANMSHELRTPLNSIILLSSMIRENKKGNLNKDDIKKANIINSSGEELLRLINDVLDLSKIEAGKMELHTDSFDSTSFINEIKDMFEYSVTNKGIEFIAEDHYNNIIITDRDKLSQIVRNFLSNSLKFTQKGYIKFSIEEDNNIKIYVQDTGIGISKEKLSVIFDAFTQADGSTSRKYGGTGLGLSITKQFSKLMGGDVFVESKEGEGSIFTVVIPNIKKNKEIKYSQKEETVSIKNDDRDKIVKSSKPFLVIEDNETFASILKESINEKGDLAIIETTGKDGLKAAKEFEHIQGILLDLGLPDMDGIEVLKTLKSDLDTKSIPVYIISGKKPSKEDEFKEAVGFKQKPLSNDDFQSVFKELEEYNNKQIKNLLIVEEDKKQRESMIEYLSMDSVNIIGTGKIDEAIKYINTGDLDAIVVDLTIENKSTFDICEYIKNNNLDIPIVVYTKKALSKEQEDKIKQYNSTIIVKSVDSNEILKNEVEGFLHKVKSNNKNQSIATSKFDLKGKKILVADDDMRNTFILVEILEDINAQVLTAANGKEALEQLQNNTDVDLILMDIMMPVMDGYEAIGLIKDNDLLKDIPIIALTAKAMQQDRQKCLDVGADDFLTKPLNMETFTGVISSWIN
ncbi:MAG: response regulator, partial [Campylobacterota bacterium]|nr:response regulator [Campylobacterota bacterium]